jgi:uncharacterized protein YecE (DUF72 family)
MNAEHRTLNVESACNIRIGTSGYSYPEWREAGFYPPDTPARAMLAAYARHFAVTELNYTWYQMPKATAMARTVETAPAGFDFAVKLTRSMTHEIDPQGWPTEVARFREGIAPLIQAGRLPAVLAQFPAAFDRSPEHRRYLARLFDRLEGLPLAVEFRHRSWAEERVVAELRNRRITLTTVDAPDLPYLFPTVEAVTNPALFYIRFHGRNLRGWRSGSMQKQFDYDYSAEELRRWSGGIIPRLAARARAGLIFFNNHVRGQAPRNAQLLMQQLAPGR